MYKLGPTRPDNRRQTPAGFRDPIENQSLTRYHGPGSAQSNWVFRITTPCALTDERALVLSHFLGRSLTSMSIEDLGSVELSGSSTIRSTPDTMQFVGMLPRSWPLMRGRGAFFEEISDAATVLTRIRELRRGLRKR